MLTPDDIKAVAEMVAKSQNQLFEQVTSKVQAMISAAPTPVPANQSVDAEVFKLEPGIYKLTKDVPNPAGDRRVTTAFDKISVWPKGARLTVRKLNASGKSKRFFSVEPHDPIVETRNDRLIHVEKGAIYNNTQGFSELVANLKKEPESVETVIEEIGFSSPLEALNALKETGKVTYEDLRHLREPNGAKAGQAEAPF